jgi:hypothetical protein
MWKARYVETQRRMEDAFFSRETFNHEQLIRAAGELAKYMVGVENLKQDILREI